MLSRITFSIVNPKGKYSHFIEPSGDTIAVYPMGTIPELKVGVVCDDEFPSDKQREAIAYLAGVATGYEPNVIIEFEDGTSPFRGLMPDYPPYDECARISQDPLG